MKIYNSLTREIEEFTPLKKGQVTLYTCGPTVYDYDHIGHGWKYVHDDLLRRLLEYNGLKVKHVQNVTDVGHLVSDGDEGEDKLEKGAKRSGKTVWEVAKYYTDAHFASMDLLNVLRPTVSCKATEHIPEQIALVQRLVDKGFAYDTPEAVYFDIAKFPRYGELFGQNVAEKLVAVREEVHTGEHKRHPADFALWFKRVGRFTDHTMHWDSPWGDGFPGWHIECSAMAMKYLGETIDIHTGGVDHLPIHHPNEIAQSEAATGKPFARYWVHYSHVMVDGAKMSKSLNNFFRVEDIVERGFSPLALRYLFLTAHYRTHVNFTWSGMAAAQSAYDKLVEFVRNTQFLNTKSPITKIKTKMLDGFKKQFDEAINNDMGLPQAVAIMWEMLRSNVTDGDKLAQLLDWDRVLGLNLAQVTEELVPMEVKNLGMEREMLRQKGKFVEADNLRMQIEKLGWEIDDSVVGSKYKKLKNG